MVGYKINKMKIFNPTINKIVNEKRYDTEDVTEMEKKFIQKFKPVPRISRVDLAEGDLVVILEGIHMGKKAVFIKQLPGFKALVSGVSTINGISLFKIDERYLFKLSSKVEVPSISGINIDRLYESKMNEAEKVDADLSNEEANFDKMLLASISKIPYMKSYLAEPFKVSNDVEFYSREY